MEITIEDVRKFLTDNKEVEEVLALVKEFAPKSEPEPITSEQVQEYLQTDEGQQLVQPMIDSRVTDAIKTYKNGHFDKEVRAAVAAEMLKVNPKETPEQKQIRELRENQDKLSHQMEQERLQGQIKELAFNEGVPPQFIKSVKFDTLEEAALYMKQFKSELEEAKKTAVNELLASGYQPGSGNGAGKGNTQNVDLAGMSPEEIIRLEESGELDTILSQ